MQLMQIQTSSAASSLMNVWAASSRPDRAPETAVDETLLQSMVQRISAETSAVAPVGNERHIDISA
jgi:hypothetical protein